jgi:hypothetical protein
MSVLGSPPALAAILALLAAAIHPALRLAERTPAGSAAVAGLLALVVLGALVRARGGWNAMLVGAGALAAVLGLGYDALRGRTGWLALMPGGGAQRFEELGPGGRVLGLRPLGFELHLEAVDADGAVRLRTGDGPLTVSRHRAAAAHGFRLGTPDLVATGEAQALRVRIEREGEAREVVVSPERPAQSGDLELGVERYFPDFALDANNDPYTRSAEPRNPAALLAVSRGGKEFRVFVLRSAPGIHRQDGLAESFSLLSVEVEHEVRLGVYREPAMPLVGAGVLLAAAGVLLGARRP